MMKVIGFCMWFLLLGVAFNCALSGTMTVEADAMTSGRISRKIMEIVDGGDESGVVSLEDYKPYDPSPSSKASIKPGPIEHGTHLNPYIPSPKPSPPPRPDDSP